MFLRSIALLVVASVVLVSSFELPPEFRSQGFQSKRMAAPFEPTSDPNMWCGTDENAPSDGTHFFAQGYTTPGCGKTICDDPALVRGYSGALYLGALPAITIPYKVYYYANTDGSNPLVSSSQNSNQQSVLNAEYAALGVQWQGSSVVLPNTWWRNSWVVNCPIAQLNDTTCQSSCSKFINGFDAGSCPTAYANFINACGPNGLSSECRTKYPWFYTYRSSLLSTCGNSMPGDGTCQPQCNFKAYNWDGGDCCNQGANPTSDPFLACKNPLSPNRAWRSPDEFRQQINATATSNLNIYIVQLSPDDSLLGFATLPWSATYNMSTGGAVFAQYAWGTFPSRNLYGVTAVHELGHVLGLYHPFHSEELTGPTGCANTCWESPGHSSMLNGDLCADTNATPVNYDCQDPISKDPCTNVTYSNTPYQNFMNYGDDLCLNQFSQIQKARMRCYIDLKYGQWTNQALPSTIAQQPSINVTGSGIQVSWNPPINAGLGSSASSLRYSVKKQDTATNAVFVFPSTTSLNLTDTTCTNTTRCVYSVKAQNSAGDAVYYSPPSNFDLDKYAIPTPTPLVLSGATTVAPSTIQLIQNIILLIVLSVAALAVF